MRRLHHHVPDVHRQVAANALPGRRIVVIAKPNPCNHVTCIANKPGVAVVLAGAGLARRLPAGQLGLLGRAARQHLAQHAVHHRHILRLDDAAIARRPPLVQQFAVGGANFQYDMVLHADAAIGEGRVGGHQFQRRHLGGAERQRGVDLQIRLDAEPVRHLGDAFSPRLQAEPHRHRVERLRQRLCECDRPLILLRIILRLPTFDIDFGVFAQRVRGQPALQRRQKHKGLEGGAGLALGRDGAVELAVSIVAPADQRLDGAIGIHHHQSALRHPIFSALGRQLLGQRLLCHRLQSGIQSRRNNNILVNRPDCVVQNIHHMVGGVID